MNLTKIPIGYKSPKEVNAIVEIPKGSNTKYEYNSDWGVFELDRCLCSSMIYTCSYGFIPQTYAPDEDNLDICIYNNIPINTGTLVRCKVVGCIKMHDEKVIDYKVIGVPLSNIHKYETVDDLDPHWVTATLNFFKHYKIHEDKEVTVDGLLSLDETYEIINESNTRWRQLQAYHQIRNLGH